MDDNKQFKIDGYVTNAEGQTLFLDAFVDTKVELIDSVVIGKKGSFELINNNLEGMFYRLRLSNNKFITLYLENGDKVKITTDVEKFDQDYTVTGSEISRGIRDFIMDMRSDNTLLDALNKMVMDAQGTAQADSVQLVAQEKYTAMLENRTKAMLAALEKNKDNVLGVYITNYLQPDQHFEVLTAALENFKSKNIGKPYWNLLESNLEPFKILASLKEGAEAPEISLPDPNGKILSLSALRGKLVLIDFWASWCKPCRVENPNVVALYNDFKAKGFEILGVSLDSDKQKWLNAIKDDKLTWYHISDLRNWESQAAADYGVRSIPATFLIDESGKIIAKNLRGEALRKKVAEVLSN